MILVISSFVIIFSWFFLRPLFLVVADPFILLYSKTKTSLYSSGQRTKAFFTTKEESLRYIHELEEENSRLHNALSLIEHENCTPLPRFDEVGASSTDFTLLDPCVMSALSKKPNEVILKVSPMTAPVSALYDTVRISKGSVDGIVADDLVYTRGRVVVGKVVSTTRNTSLVLLYAKDGTETFGTLKGNDTSFKVVGNGGSSYIALLPRDVQVKEGDTALLTENQDFALGTVVSVTFLKQDVSQKVYIKGGFNPSALGALYVTISK